MKTSTHPSCLQTLMLLCTAIPMLICLASLVCAQETLPSWTNRAGKTIKAQFVRLDGEAVVIEKDGKEFRVPFDKLSADSQQQAKTLGSPAQSARAEPSAPPPNSSKPVTLAKDGKTNVVIVESNNAAEPERYAALELAEFLGRVTGATFPIVHEGGFAGKTPAIYVGWTDYAAKNGVDAAALGEEEWVIRTGDDNLILAGGRPRGTLYAVYEFLERPVGCHWLAPDCEVIPSRPSLTLDALNVQGKPWFWRREVLNFPGCSDAQWKFMIRNKNYRYDLKGCRDFSPAGAFYQLQGSPRKVHTFAYFVNGEDYFAAHPEYFALDASGKRIPAYPDKPPGGQLCLTHPDVRRLTKAKLREYIAKDRAEAAEKGCPPPRVYSITQSDQFIITDLHCKCDACQAIAKREGSESGPLIDFINDIAADIEKDYPDVLIQTLAYNLTSVPPKTIKPRKNVLIGWCDVYGISDGARPLSDPLNTRNYREITEWAKVAPRLVIVMRSIRLYSAG